jgi:hypothetical protein
MQSLIDSRFGWFLSVLISLFLALSAGANRSHACC